jgi:hypothetical protein
MDEEPGYSAYCSKCKKLLKVSNVFVRQRSVFVKAEVGLAIDGPFPCDCWSDA